MNTKRIWEKTKTNLHKCITLIISRLLSRFSCSVSYFMVCLYIDCFIYLNPQPAYNRCINNCTLYLWLSKDELSCNFCINSNALDSSNLISNLISVCRQSERLLCQSFDFVKCLIVSYIAFWETVYFREYCP